MTTEFPGMMSLDVVFFERGRRTVTTFYWASREELVGIIQEVEEEWTQRITGWSEEDVDHLLSRLTMKLAETPWEVLPRQGGATGR